MASSASEAASPSRAGAVVARSSASRLRATNTSASSRSTPDSTNDAIAPSSTSSASASDAALRLAAAAGLLSSCARPADIWPSAAIFSRCSVAPSIRAMTGRKTRITRRNASGVWNSSWRNVSGSICATRQRSEARSDVIAAASESARIAPSQVGATWRCSSSCRPSIMK